MSGTKLWIGPVEIDELFEVSFSADSGGVRGKRQISIGGEVYWHKAQELSELSANESFYAYSRDQDGVFAYIMVEHESFWPFRGWCLINDFNLGADDFSLLWGPTERLVPIKLSGLLVGDNLKIVSQVSARAKPNSVSVSGKALVVNPFWDFDPAGSDMLIPPAGGTKFSREYNTADYGAVPQSRNMTMYEVSPVGSLLAVPKVELRSDRVPEWVSSRGGKPRAYDLREMRYVQGAHSYRIPTDAMIENGLVRIRVGNQGIAPYVNFQAFSAGGYVDCGSLLLDQMGSTLEGARLYSLAPDAVTLALPLMGKGDCFITLRRGERGLRISMGTDELLASPSAARLSWSGLPPTSSIVGSLTSSPGRYGNGVNVAAGNFELLWPVTQREEEWALACNWTTEDDSTTQTDHRLWVIQDESGLVDAVTCAYQASTKTFIVHISGLELETAPLVFGAGEHIHVNVRHSSQLGTTVSIKVGAGAVFHYNNPAMLFTGIPGGRYHHVGFGGFGSGVAVPYGDGNYGDGFWGGIAGAGSGVIDNIMLFEDRLENYEAQTLASSLSATGGIPVPHARMILHATLDPTVIPTSVAFGNSRVESGVDANGFFRYLLTLDHTASGTDFALQGDFPFQLIAGLAKSAPKDAVGDHHTQFGAEYRQRELVR